MVLIHVATKFVFGIRGQKQKQKQKHQKKGGGETVPVILPI